MAAVVTQEFWSQLIEELFEGSAVAQSLLQLRDQFSGHVHATAAALVGKGQDVSGMFVAASAGRTVGADAGFADFGQGAFDRGPEFCELAEKVLAEKGIGRF
ncbi:MAG: hypothetical protein C5B50_09130 [Verrucomicrobia bacterium]|nr:MAG: hypothetical protein C5B50_09130 [Verrucomicrobiota bacterium]